VYLVMATAQFSLRSAFDLSAVLPLLNVSSFGHGFLMLELALALFAAAAAIALWVDRPERPQRSVAELLATTGALLAALAVLTLPGATGHPGTTSPRGVALALDAIHLGAGSIWLGGLIGLLALWRNGAQVFGRFSDTALGAVIVLILSGSIAALLHLPTIATLWDTGWGQALLVKIALLLVALVIAARNRKHRRATTWRVGGEVVLLGGAVFAAAVLTSLAPPAKALADLGKPQATVGPGAVRTQVTKNGYTVAVRVDPNKAATNNRFAVTVTKGGKPVTGAGLTATFAMLDMEMGNQEYKLAETRPGSYERDAPALVMVGRWGLTLDVEPPGATPFAVTLLDHAAG
jgi:copper transport protein